MARAWLGTMGPTGQMQHGMDKGMGQNLYSCTRFGSSASDTPENDIGRQATQKWYSEIKNFDYLKPEGPHKGVTGHFTQVVWKATTHVGMAVWCRAGKTFVCANYLPQGNYRGRRAENVPPLS
mmetsp:Transcript_10200/g.19306  ORF Transcript_10200/g.19306 Transcript_10200/m.19306 type:complete len:123 (-) Transcript_10200:21-389(-)